MGLEEIEHYARHLGVTPGWLAFGEGPASMPTSEQCGDHLRLERLEASVRQIEAMLAGGFRVVPTAK